MALDAIRRRELLETVAAAGVTTGTLSVAGCIEDSEPEGDSTETPEDASTEMPERGPVIVTTTTHDGHGEVLADDEGMVLYMFDPDDQDESTCYDGCADNWPPLVTAGEDLVKPGDGTTAELGTVERDDGELQVTASGWPLYYYAGDEAPGDATGQGVNDVWWVLEPDGSVIREEEEAPTPSPEDDDGGYGGY